MVNSKLGPLQKVLNMRIHQTRSYSQVGSSALRESSDFETHEFVTLGIPRVRPFTIRKQVNSNDRSRQSQLRRWGIQRESTTLRV